MQNWLELAIVLNLLLTVALIAITAWRRPNRDSDKLLNQIGVKLDLFISSAAQDSSNLRTEIISSLSSESSQLRQELTSSLSSASNQTRSTLEDLRNSTNARLDKLTADLTLAQNELREALNSKINLFQTQIAGDFSGFRDTQTTQGDATRTSVENTLSNLGRTVKDSVAEFRADMNNRMQVMEQQTTALKDSLETQQTTLRDAVEKKLEKLNEQNTKKLDEMRETVDEKLHKTLETRLTESFGIVTEHLGRVQSGLGEMKDLASGVGDLKRLLTNVRTRGSIGEFAVEMQLQQMLAPNQFIRNVATKPGSRECVEFAVRIPMSDDSEVLLPIDSKFPKEDWERLEDALERDDKEAAKNFRKALLSRIRGEAKKISELYVYPPITTDLAILCLSTEGLYSEALREPGFTDSIRSEFHVMISGPTTFMAILSSLQMGFKTLAIQKKGSEVWNLLGATKTEFAKFGTLMAKVEKQVGTVQNTLHEVGRRTRAINRTLSAVEMLEMAPSKQSNPLQVDQADLEVELAAVDADGDDDDPIM